MKALLEKIAQLRMLVVGDAILDHYIFGDANRISPEAPVPVVEVDHVNWVAGGAANVAVNLAALGVRAELLGVVGDDPAGHQLRELLKMRLVQMDPSICCAAAPTIVKTRVVVRNQQLCRIDREAPPVKYRFDFAKHGQAVADKIAGVDAVIVSDYAKGVITDDFLLFLKENCRLQQVYLACDPKPKRRLDLRGFDLITPNRAESLQMAGLEMHPQEEYPAAQVCRIIHEKFAPGLLVVTLGADGMLLSRKGEMRKQLPTYAREVYDVSGAGDTAVAVLTAALSAGANDEEAAALANTAAGIVVGKFGTATATPEEILNYHP